MADYVEQAAFAALSQVLLDRLDQHSVRIDVAQDDAWNALDKSFEALSTIYQTGLDAQVYTDRKIQQLRDELGGAIGGIGGGIPGQISDGIGAGIDGALAEERQKLVEAIAKVDQVAAELGFGLDDTRSLTEQILDVELPSQREEIENLALREMGTRGTLDLFLQDFDHSSVAAGLDAMRAELEEDIKPMRNTYLRLPASHWTTQPDSMPFSPKLPPAASWFITDDAFFGDCLDLPAGRVAVGPSLHIPFSNKAVYKLTVRFRVTASPAGGATVKAGMTTWRTSDTPAEQAAEITLAAGLALGALNTLSCYVTSDAAMQLMLEEDGSVPVLRLMSSGGATRAFPYFAQPADGTRLRIDMFEIRDVTDSVQAMRYANVRLGSAFENIVNIQRDVEEALAGFDPDNSMATIWSFASGWKGWATTTDMTKHPAEVTEVLTGTLVENPAYSGGIAANLTGISQLVLAKYIPILPDSVLDTTLFIKAATATAIEIVLTSYDSLNQKLSDFVVHSGTVPAGGAFLTRTGQKNGGWGANAARAWLSLRVNTAGASVEIDGFRATDSTAQYYSSRAVAASNTATEAKNDAEGAAASAVDSLALAVAAKDAAGDHALAALSHANSAAASSGAAETAASAASATRLAVEALQNTGMQLPDTFIGGLGAFTTARTGAPSAAPTHSKLTLGAADTDFGPFGKWLPTVIGENVLTRGVQRINGRIIRLTLDFKIIAIAGGGTVSLTPTLVRLDSAYTEALTNIAAVALGVGRHTLTYVMAAEAFEGVTHVIAAMNTATRSLGRAGLRLNETKDCEIRLGRIAFEDITFEGKAADSLAKAVIAKNAAVQASSDAEGSKATAVDAKNLAVSANNEAQTAKADAVLARTDAVSAMNGANTAAVAASSSAEMAVRVSGRGDGVLADKVMPYPGSASVPGWVAWATAPTVEASTSYPRGKRLRFNLAATTQAGLQLTDSQALWVGPTRSKSYRVDIEFTLLSGSPSGAGVLFDFITAAGNNRQVKTLADMCSGGIVLNKLMVASAEFTLPSGVNLGSVTGITVYAMMNYATGLDAMAAKNIQLHSIQIYPMTATEAAIQEQRTAIADLEGNAAAGYLIKAQAGNEVSLLNLVAADGVSGPKSVARLKASDIILDGSVYASSMAVMDLGNYVPDPDMQDPASWTPSHPTTNRWVQNPDGHFSASRSKGTFGYIHANGGPAGSDAFLYSRAFIVTPGEELHLVAQSARSGGTLSRYLVQIVFFMRNGDPEYSSPISVNSAQTGVINSTGQKQVPAGAYSARVRIYVYNGAGETNGNIFFGGLEIRRKTNLFVDGSIKAIHADFASLTALKLKAEVGEIGEAAVRTLELADGSVTLQWGAEAYSLTINLSYAARLIIMTNVRIMGTNSEHTTRFQLKRNGAIVEDTLFSVDQFTNPYPNFAMISVSAGTHTFTHSYVRISAGEATNHNTPRIAIFGAYR